MGGSGGGASAKLRKVAKKLILLPCGSFTSSRLVDPGTPSSATVPADTYPSPVLRSEFWSPPTNHVRKISEMAEEGESIPNFPAKNVCTICLEPLINNNAAVSPGQAVFTSQCSHAFHLACISSNIRHGNITCPICRAQWTRLPHNLHPPCWPPRNQDDPILQILDDSISTFRVHRRSFLRSARYDDDDPVEPETDCLCQPRLCFTLIPLGVPQSQSLTDLCSYSNSIAGHSTEQISRLSPRVDLQLQSSNSLVSQYYCHKSRRAAYLSVKLAQKQAIDLVLVASPNGPHLRLLKQSMSLVVFSLRAMDRLAIVSYSSAAARIFPLRRMTSCGKRAALQVIDRLFYAGHADPAEGIKKGTRILKDRTHMNPQSAILHLCDNPTGTSKSYRTINDAEMQRPIPVHQFHVASTGSIMHELEGLMAQLVGGGIRDTQLRIGGQEETRFVRLGELRGDDERRILLEMDESSDHVPIVYSYAEDGVAMDECVRTGEAVVSFGDKRGIRDVPDESITAGRTSSVETWDYHDPYMARRWAKRLHGRQRQ